MSALIDTGSVINGLSEEWFNVNKKDIEPYEILPMTNSLIISAIGNKSKLIRKQILCDIETVSYTHLDVYKRQIYNTKTNQTKGQSPVAWLRRSEMEHMLWGLSCNEHTYERNTQ